MSSKRKQVFISSLSLCTAYCLLPVEGATALAQPVDPTENNDTVLEQIVEEALYRYYNPLAMLENIRPLKQSKEPLKITIKPGDTLSEIAKVYHLPEDLIARYNHIKDPNKIRAGKTLMIPYRVKEIRVKEVLGLETLALKYDVSEALMRELNPQLVKANGKTYLNQVVSVPERLDVSPPAASTLAESQPSKKRGGVRLASRGAVAENAGVKRASAAMTATLVWPVGGQITSPYGYRGGHFHRGIDIWNAQEGQMPIKVAASGVVTRAGHDGNYGNLVVVDHGGGWATYYAHLRVITVGIGQEVQGGTVVGYMGKTGNATGYHLHFEVRHNGESMNPLTLLP